MNKMNQTVRFTITIFDIDCELETTIYPFVPGTHYFPPEGPSFDPPELVFPIKINQLTKEKIEKEIESLFDLGYLDEYVWSAARELEDFKQSQPWKEEV